MPANQPPEINWHEIKQRSVAGESFRAIAKTVPISHVAISKRAKKEGWLNKQYQPDTTALTFTQKALSHGNRTPDNAEHLLILISEHGISPTNAGATMGLSPDVISEWRKSDVVFEEQIQLARRAYLGTREEEVKKAGDRGDLRANLAILERAPETREYWAGEKSQSGGITVILNMADPKPVEPPTITIEQNSDDAH